MTINQKLKEIIKRLFQTNNIQTAAPDTIIAQDDYENRFEFRRFKEIRKDIWKGNIAIKYKNDPNLKNTTAYGNFKIDTEKIEPSNAVEFILPKFQPKWNPRLPENTRHLAICRRTLFTVKSNA